MYALFTRSNASSLLPLVDDCDIDLLIILAILSMTMTTESKQGHIESRSYKVEQSVKLVRRRLRL